ncbi:putative zinc transporter msc2 [Gnomoniopsis smithogilvyi]|uniref:Zinc transporter n=1 Tax=Gnomoniopsis smithogilvyi TaxID=1191159 RepID=A0A9W9CSZ4_9PEZI|nr:putative zinc transporter msc2 [Gnomoniopsis smithogilvyi]
MLVTPKNASFSESYQAPEAKPPKSSHDHSAERSRFTNLLLPYTAKWPLVHSVMVEKDSRRIFYFMSLNFSFMAVQAFYGYVTDSLGLLSDSIHMFFDCVALAVGLFASVASKWPPSARFPYGFGKVETLSGFANGVFLVLISVEIMIEAFERIIEGRETKRLAELFIVSSLGLTVNLVGMAALAIITTVMTTATIMAIVMGTHTPTKIHSCNLIRMRTRIRTPTLTQTRSILIRTAIRIIMPLTTMLITTATLTLMIMRICWDPLASFLIAALIMASSVPLIRSSAQRLLLTVPDEIEYSLRDTLSGIMSLRGVAGYSVPKFWVNDRVTDSPSDKLLGSMHILATRNADLEDVRMRVRHYLADKGMDIILQVEREGDATCWCGVGKMPMSPLGVTTPLSAATPTSTISQRLKAR